jgi:uncharacterized protein (DUF1697 family)
MPTSVALLRGINLGARNRVAMADLRAALTGLGYDDVRTYLQSGNAVFKAKERSAAALRPEVERGLSDALDMELTVLIRTPAQMAKVVTADPFGHRSGGEEDLKRYNVYFVDRAIPAAAFADVDPAAIEPEELAVLGSEIYTWMPAGLRASKVAGLVTDRKRGLLTTARNWRTVRALHDLASAT